MEDKGHWSYPLDLMEKVFESEKYNLALYALFNKWRAVYQNNYHGMSSMSEIPNHEYDQKRWGLVRVIQKYLRKQPEDVWARTQIMLLLNLPAIDRGGPKSPFSNTNIFHWGDLFGYTKSQPYT